jgi:transposase
MARPSKLTEDVKRRFLASIRAGNDKKVAAAMAGISESTLYSWIEQGKREDAEPEFLEFLESLTQAEAEAEVAAVARIQQAAQNGRWQASAWWLERKYGERWGRNDKIRQEISGPNGEPLALTIEDAKKAVLAYLDEGDSKDEFINSGTDSISDEAGTTEMDTDSSR